MDLITFIIILVALFLVVEIFKHNMLRIGAKVLFLVVIIGVVLLFIVSQLHLDENLETSNPLIKTGAAVLKTIKESEIAEKFKVDFIEIKDKIKGNEDF